MKKIRLRPHRSNPPTFNARMASIKRATKPPKRQYMTDARLRRLMMSIIKKDREQWFAARLRQLNSWPVRTSAEIMEAASRVQPRRLMNGRWLWPKRELKIQQDLLLSAPKDSVDVNALRALLERLDERQGDRLIKMLIESGYLTEATAPLDNGLPQPAEVRLTTLHRIRRAYRKLRRDLAGDSDGAIAMARPPEVPRANIHSNWTSSRLVRD